MHLKKKKGPIKSPLVVGLEVSRRVRSSIDREIKLGLYKHSDRRRVGNDWGSDSNINNQES